MEITIKEHIPYINKKQKAKNIYPVPCLNWTWIISSNGKMITYGYAHSQDIAMDIAKNELKNRSRFTCVS